MVTINTSEPNPALKRLLSDLESFGGRQKATFIDICNRAPAFYGAPGSQDRRNYQQARDRLSRKKTAKAYHKLVVDSGVAPSIATIQDAKMEELQNEMNDVDIKPATTAPPLRSNTPPPPSLFTPPRIRSPVPTTKVDFTSPLLGSTMSVTDETMMMDNFWGVPLDPNAGWDPHNPHIIPVSRKNIVLPHGFTGMFSDALQGIGSYDRDVYYITKTTGGDLTEYSASIPEDGMFDAKYNGRCILVEGPGLDYIHSDKITLESALNDALSSKTNQIPLHIGDGLQRAWQKLKGSFNRTGEKKKQYYLFVYPENTVLDNKAISGEGAGNKVKSFGFKICSKFSIFRNREHTNLVLFWAIATQADEDRRVNEFDGKLDAKDFEF